MPQIGALDIVSNFIIVYRKEQLQYQLLHQSLKQKPLTVWKEKVNGYVV